MAEHNSLSEWLRSTLAKRGLSASAVASHAGVSRATVQRVLDPTYSFTPSRATVLKLERALGEDAPAEDVSLADLSDNADDDDVQFVARVLLGVHVALVEAIERKLDGPKSGPPAISASATTAQVAQLALALGVIAAAQFTDIARLMVIASELENGRALADLDPSLTEPWLDPHMDASRLLRPSIMMWESILAITAASGDVEAGLSQAEKMIAAWGAQKSQK